MGQVALDSSTSFLFCSSPTRITNEKVSAIAIFTSLALISPSMLTKANLKELLEIARISTAATNESRIAIYGMTEVFDASQYQPVRFDLV